MVLNVPNLLFQYNVLFWLWAVREEAQAGWKRPKLQNLLFSLFFFSPCLPLGYSECWYLLVVKRKGVGSSNLVLPLLSSSAYWIWAFVDIDKDPWHEVTTPRVVLAWPVLSGGGRCSRMVQAYKRRNAEPLRSEFSHMVCVRLDKDCSEWVYQPHGHKMRARPWAGGGNTLDLSWLLPGEHLAWPVISEHFGNFVPDYHCCP